MFDYNIKQTSQMQKLTLPKILKMKKIFSLSFFLPNAITTTTRYYYYIITSVIFVKMYRYQKLKQYQN